MFNLETLISTERWNKKTNVKTENKELVIENNLNCPDSSNFQRNSLQSNNKFQFFVSFCIRNNLNNWKILP